MNGWPALWQADRKAGSDDGRAEKETDEVDHSAGNCDRGSFLPDFFSCEKNIGGVKHLLFRRRGGRDVSKKFP